MILRVGKERRERGAESLLRPSTLSWGLNELLPNVRLRLERTLEARTEINVIGRHPYRNQFQNFSKYFVKHYPITVRLYILRCFTTSILQLFNIAARNGLTDSFE